MTIDRVVEVTFGRGTRNRTEIELACCSSRGDVRAVFPVTPRRSGFSGVFNWCLLPPGKHTISLLFESSTGKTLTLTREIITRCEHPEKPFLSAGEFDWQSVVDGCMAGPDATLVFRPRPDVCDGEVRYAWSQAAQGLVLASDCIPDAANPPPPECSDRSASLSTIGEVIQASLGGGSRWTSRACAAACSRSGPAPRGKT